VSLPAYRGMLVVGRLLNDQALTRDALARVDRFTKRGFYHDGFWQQGGLVAHRRVVGRLGNWIEPIASNDGQPPTELPLFALARAAESAVIADAPPAEILQAGWASPAVQ